MQNTSVIPATFSFTITDGTTVVAPTRLDFLSQPYWFIPFLGSNSTQIASSQWDHNRQDKNVFVPISDYAQPS